MMSARGRRDQLVDVFCWCGRTIVAVDQSVIDACSTAECSVGCRLRFERYGAHFDGWDFSGKTDAHHPMSCNCSEACFVRRQAHDRERYNRRKQTENARRKASR